MSTSRLSYFDFIRGIAIVMVVAIHTTTSCNIETISGTISTIVRQCLNCAVPLFLASSAFFLSKVDTSNWHKHFSFLKKQVPKVYIPTLIWSLPCMIYAIYSGGDIFSQFILLISCSYSVYYFIALIIQFYLLLPILNKSPKITLIISTIITIVCLFIFTSISINNPLPLMLYAGPFTSWILFFALGLYLANCNRLYSLAIPFILILLGIVFQFAELYYISSTFNYFSLDIKTSSALYSSGIILLLFSKKVENFYNNYSNSKALKLFEFFGKKSFIIYLCHCYIISFVSSIYYTSFWSFNFTVCFTLTILFILLLQKIVPKSIHKQIGIN